MLPLRNLLAIAAVLLAGDACVASPSTAIPYDAMKGGFTLLKGPERAGRAYGVGGYTLWGGTIRGTRASLAANSDYGMNSGGNGLIDVSVDGAPFAKAAIAGSEFVLFTGLTDGSHTVLFRYAGDYALAPYVPTSGAVMHVEGKAAAVIPFGDWQSIGDARNNAVTATALKPFKPDYTPPLLAPPPPGNGEGGNPLSIGVRGDYRTLAIATTRPLVFVSQDGATPRRFTDVHGMVVIPNLSGVHDYFVWTDHPTSPSGDGLSVGGHLTGSPLPFTGGRLDQYGDSITDGEKAGGTAYTETFPVAAQLGRVAGSFGITGDNAGGLLARLPNILAEKTVTAGDVAVIAIGRNDMGFGDRSFDEGTRNAYRGLVNALLAKGYGAVLCRGVLREKGQTWPGKNGSIRAIALAFKDARVKYIDPSRWPVEATADGIHPTPEGFQQIAPSVLAAYRAALAR